MLGPILVFVFVCILVAIFMAIAHSFLRASEEDEQIVNEDRMAAARREQAQADQDQTAAGASRPSQPQWAH